MCNVRVDTLGHGSVDEVEVEVEYNSLLTPGEEGCVWELLDFDQQRTTWYAVPAAARRCGRPQWET